MSGRDERTEIRRIVVPFDTAPPIETALEAAAGLAAALDAELFGLFVEDVNLLRTARLPFARELGLASAVPRPLGEAELERAIQQQAERSRAWLASIASDLGLRWSFQVVRGEALSAVLECWREPDLLVWSRAVHVSTARGAAPSAPGREFSRAGLRHRERFRSLRQRPVAVLFDGSEQALRALEVACALAATAGSRLIVLVLASDKEEFGRLRDSARRWLASRDRAVQFKWLRSRLLSGIGEAMRNEDAAVLIWHDVGTAQAGRELAALSAVLHCPVVLLS
jgi:nucleotide-binding universal stress UspA family protein